MVHKVNKLKIAIVGCGQIADAHAQEINKIKHVVLCATCDNHHDLALQLAERFGVPKSYDNLDEMLAVESPDVVHITTPPHTHRQIASKCISAGSHIYVEKPFTVDVAEAESLLLEASVNNKLVCVGHDQLFDPIWKRFQKMNSQFLFGNIVHVDSIMGYNLDGPFGRVMLGDSSHWVHRLPGGLIQNNISHAVYKITDILSDRTPRIGAYWFGKDSSPPSELRVSIQGENCTANLIFSASFRPCQRVVRVYGSKSIGEIDFESKIIRVSKSLQAPGAFGKIEAPFRHFMESSKSLLSNIWAFIKCDIHYFAGMNLLFREFYASVAKGSALPIAPEEIRRVTAIMDQIFITCKNPDLTAANRN